MARSYFNNHLTHDCIDGAPGLGDSSDHGQLVARLAIDTKRLPT